MKDKLITDRFYDNENLWCAVLLVLATLLSFFPILVLKDGGSWTFFSLLPLWLITYFFGLRTGLIGSFMFTIFKFVATFISEAVFAGTLADPTPADMVKSTFIKGPVVFILEYLIACTGFCLGGLLKSNRECERYISIIKASRRRTEETPDAPYLSERIYALIKKRRMLKNAASPADAENRTGSLTGGCESSISFEEYDKYPLPIGITGDKEKENSSSGLIFGYLIGVFVMFVCYVVAAPYYDAYPAGVTTTVQRLMYDIKYDGSYLLAEAATTVLVLAIPPVRETIFTLKHVANNPKEDPTSTAY